MTERTQESARAAAELYAEVYPDGLEAGFDTAEIPLGPWTSYSLLTDPKHMCFVLSRYKFCAKILEGKAKVLEIGIGDGFGLPIVAQAVGHLYAADWDPRLLDGAERRLHHLTNVTYLRRDLNQEAAGVLVDAAYWIDVIEHIDPGGEARFLENIISSLTDDGVLITGTPNVTAASYATERSKLLHINLKSMRELRELMQRYFKNVFMFGMNDEVLHTGYAPMCHYIWSVAVGVRRQPV